MLGHGPRIESGVTVEGLCHARNFFVIPAKAGIHMGRIIGVRSQLFYNKGALASSAREWLLEGSQAFGRRVGRPKGAVAQRASG